jgi:hypothetical protein
MKSAFAIPIAMFCMVWAALPLRAQVSPKQTVTQAPAREDALTTEGLIRIVEIEPTEAAVGSAVRMAVQWNLSLAGTEEKEKVSAARAEVLFDGMAAEVVEAYPTEMTVIVPAGLEAGSRPDIRVRYGRVRSPSYKGLTIVPLMILEASKNRARSGEEIWFRLSSDIGSRDVKIRFGGILARILDLEGYKAYVEVPPGLKGGTRPVIEATLGDSPVEPYTGLLISGAWYRDWKMLLGMGVLGAVGLFFLLRWILRLRRGYARMLELEQESGRKAYQKAEAEPVRSLSVPDLPQGLVRDCVADNCVLYVGAGLSARAGMPTWQPFVGGLLEWATGQGIVDDEFAVSLRAGLEQGEVDSVADSVVSSALEASRSDDLNEYLKEVFIRSSPTLPRTHRVLADIGFSAVLTTNFDNLLEEAHRGSMMKVYTPIDAEALLDALPQKERFILNLYGTLDRPATVLVAPAQYHASVGGTSPFQSSCRSSSIPALCSLWARAWTASRPTSGRFSSERRAQPNTTRSSPCRETPGRPRPIFSGGVTA